jgi:predicted AAA+ superfamily ATPase
LQGDDPKDALLLENQSAQELAEVVSGYELIVIDEAQRIKDIGTTLKLIADNVPDVKVIASGSSSFDLANKLSEPLTGRNRKFYLYPLSIPELIAAYGKVVVSKDLETYMTFGLYPKIVSAESREEKALLVRELANDYLFKDLFMFGDIRNSFAFEKLIKLLALRVGSEISYTELAKEVGISRDTVLNYVNLLEQAFIVFRLTPFYTNKTKEINKNHKIYFYDLGIRNALLNNNDPLELRPDKGAIFENFFIAEKVKAREYAGRNGEIHFWKARSGGEIDYVEVFNGEIKAFECKWKEMIKASRVWVKTYPNSHFECITMENIINNLTE